MYRHLGVVCLAFCLSFACGESPSFESARFGLDDPIPCFGSEDPVCDDGVVCNYDACLDGICRHTLAFVSPLCCVEDSDCDDINICTDDSCGPDNECVFVENDMPNCCTVHEDCGPGGEWDDGFPWTIDFCQDNQCMHVLNPCSCEEGFTCLPDDDICTSDECDVLTCTCVHIPIQDCCEVSADCDDGNVCTQGSCIDQGFAFPKCEHTAVAGCCNEDLECDDGNPCTDDSCVNHKCRNPATTTPDCCMSDADCDYLDECSLVSYCDLEANTCIVIMNPNPGPCACCWSAFECSDGNVYTLDQCVEGCCVSIPEPTICNPGLGYLCDDGDLCTQDECVEINPDWGGQGKCIYSPIVSCCHSDEECDQPGMTDDNPCTVDTCDPAAHQCVFTPKTQCCTPGVSWDECDDGNSCTDDFCIDYSCKHVNKFPGCCTSSSQCDDFNPCTIDQCDTETGLCEHSLDLATDWGCQSASDCYDGDVCTLDQCVGCWCENIVVEDCCTDVPTPFDPVCDDDNVCTCDICIYGQCRNLPPGWAPPSCNLSPSCCMETGDCEPSLDPCETVSCNLQTHLCEYVSLDDCAAALPVVHTFNYCPAMND